MLAGHGDGVWRALWSPAGDRLVTTAPDASTWVWDPATGEAVFAFDPGDASHLYADVDWSPSTDYVAIIRSSLGRVTVLDVETGVEVLTLAGHKGKVTSLDWSPTGSKTGGWLGEVHVCAAENSDVEPNGAAVSSVKVAVRISPADPGIVVE